jgi:hypothetical protein
MTYYHGNVEYKSRWHCYWWNFKYDIENFDWDLVKVGAGVFTGTFLMIYALRMIE